METGHIQRGGSLSDNITMVSNEVIRDNKMPAIDFKVLCWFLSHDKSFVIKKSSLHKHFVEGRDMVANAFKRLVEAKFIIPIEVFNSGRFDGYNYLVYPSPLTENQYSVILGKISNNDNTNVPLKENEPFTELPLTVSPYPFKKTNNKNYVENEIFPTNGLENNVPETTLLEESLKQLKLLEEKTLRHLPKSVRSKKVIFLEAVSVVDYTKIFNDIRKNYFSLRGHKVNGSTLTSAGMTSLITVIRDGHDMDQIEKVIYNLFETKYHKEENYRLLTPSFCVRDDIWQREKDLK